MLNHPLSILDDNRITRRHFIQIMSLSAAALATGCAIDPVTGKQQLMLVSEDQEIQIDKQYAPMQFSADYGLTQDKALDNYVSQVGNKMAAGTHRPHMPYSFQVVNATYINAYAFPGGSIACTRGIMLNLENEAELAALLGHELGHVNARHTAEQMSKSSVTQAVVGGLAALAGTQGAAYGQMAAQLGSLSTGALLAHYSRDNEREADALGMDYMVRSGYSPQGMVGLMDMLRSTSKHQPSAIELMFATHPMSDERYQNAVKTEQTKYKSSQDLPLYRQRYMDNTARLRAQKDAIAEMQKGEKELSRKQYGNAQAHFKKALRIAPNDYAGLILMSTTQLIQKNFGEGIRYSEKAKKVYPQEAQGYYLSGFARLQIKNWDGAYRDLDNYDQRLPGNPNIVFFKGYCQENMQNNKAAANYYHQYLQVVNQGKYAQHAYQRMQQWGYY